VKPDPIRLAKCNVGEGRCQHLAHHGMRYVRRRVAAKIPEGVKCVGPFAGHAWVAREVCKTKAKECVLGDIRRKELEWALSRHKIPARVHVQDWVRTVDQEKGPDTVFLLDPPHGPLSPYRNRRGGHAENDKNYFPEIIEKCKKEGLKCVVNLPWKTGEQYCGDGVRCERHVIHQGGKDWHYLVGWINL